MFHTEGNSTPKNSINVKYGKISPGYLQNCGPDQKALEFDSPKSLVSKAKYRSKMFFGPPKTQNIDFLKKPELHDLTE